MRARCGLAAVVRSRWRLLNFTVTVRVGNVVGRSFISRSASVAAPDSRVRGNPAATGPAEKISKLIESLGPVQGSASCARTRSLVGTHVDPWLFREANVGSLSEPEGLLSAK